MFMVSSFIGHFYDGKMFFQNYFTPLYNVSIALQFFKVLQSGVKKVGYRFSYNINALVESGNDLVNPFLVSVAFRIKTSHL